MKKIILASNSPRRKELLAKSGIEFAVHPSGYDEHIDNNNFSYAKIENIAYNKAIYVSDELKEDAVIIGADTVVVYNNKILTKPKDYDDAFNMLKTLSNVEHIVVTGLCVIDKYTNETKVNSVTTRVHFKELSDKMINDYITEYKPFDKAGGYGIQELPPEFIKYVDGSLENVIGLCTDTIKSMLTF